MEQIRLTHYTINIDIFQHNNLKKNIIFIQKSPFDGRIVFLLLLYGDLVRGSGRTPRDWGLAYR